MDIKLQRLTHFPERHGRATRTIATRDTLRRQELLQRHAVNRDQSGLIAMTEFLATLQVAYPALSVSTGLKALCFVLVGFQPNTQTAEDRDIATQPRQRSG